MRRTATRKDNVRDRFERFRRENPHVEQRLTAMLEEYERGGATRISIAHLWEIMRRDKWLTTGGELWKLNNSYRSRYARAIAKARPELAHLLRMRRLAHEPTPAELAGRRDQLDAFTIGATPEAAAYRRSIASEKRAQEALQRTQDRSTGRTGESTPDAVVTAVLGEHAVCANPDCAADFVVRRTGQKYHASRCRISDWMNRHPRLL